MALMFVSKSYNFIFVHNQKTGGIAVGNYLRKNVADLKMFLPRHSAVVDGIQNIGHDSWAAHFTFGFVRNPWARLVSFYSMIMERPRIRNTFFCYVRRHGPSFDEFITNCTKDIYQRKK